MEVSKHLLDRMTHYTTHVAAVDAEHLSILSLADRMRRLKGNDLLNAVNQIVLLWKANSATEEQLMADVQYPYSANHISDHLRLTLFFKSLPNNYGGELLHRESDILQRMFEHIDHYDMPMGQYIADKNSFKKGLRVAIPL